MFHFVNERLDFKISILIQKNNYSIISCWDRNSRFVIICTSIVPSYKNLVEGAINDLNYFIRNRRVFSKMSLMVIQEIAEEERVQKIG